MKNTGNLVSKDQRTFVESLEDAVCVLAIPGSGKTFAICERCYFLLTSEHVFETKGQVSILALTFTSEAAESLKDKTKARLGIVAEDRLTTGTFHSYLLRALKRVGAEKAFLNIASAGQSDQFMDSAFVTNYGEKWLEKFKDERKRVRERKKLQQIRQAIFLGLVDERDYFEEKKILDQFKLHMTKSGFIDFDSIMEEADLFIKTKGKGIKRKRPEQNKFEWFTQEKWDAMNWDAKLKVFVPESHIIVDEAQDIDELQLRFLEGLCENGRNLDIVGDDDQSIYSFRNSLGYEGMRRLIDSAGMNPVIKFQDNYRSAPLILQNADPVISQIDRRKRMQKTLNPTLSPMPGNEVCIAEYKNSDEEIMKVVNHILKLKIKDDSFKNPKSTAIICRLNKDVRRFEKYLMKHDLEYQCKPGESIWEVQPLCFVVQLLKDTGSDADNEGIYQSLIWANLLTEERKSEVISGNEEIDSLILEELLGIECKIRSIGESDYFKCDEESAKLLADLYTWFVKAVRYKNRKLGLSEKQDVHDERLLRIGFECIAGRYVIECAKNALEGEQKPDFPSHDPKVWGRRGLPARRMQALQQLRQWDKATVSTDAIKLLTMHGSKGLQFDRVWMVACDTDTILGEPSGLSEDDKDARNDEETRLIYVGMTRAIQGLYISSSEADSDNPRGPSGRMLVHLIPIRKMHAEFFSISSIDDSYIEKYHKWRERNRRASR